MSQDSNTPVLENVSASKSTKTEVSTESPREAVDTGKRIDVSEVKPAPVKTMRREHRERSFVKKKSSRFAKQPKAETAEKIETKEKEVVSEQKPAAKPVEASSETLKPRAVETELAKPVHKNGVNGKKLVVPVELSPQWKTPPRPDPVEWDDSGDFAAMLAEEEPVKKLDIEVGTKVRARLIYMSKDTAFFALGPKREGVMPMSELRNKEGDATIKIGDTLSVYVVDIDEAVHLSKKLSRGSGDISMLEDAKDKGIPIEGKITSVNSGGVEVSVAGFRAFCPLGQLDLHFIENAESMLGQTYLFLVHQLSGNGRNVVLNRRNLLEKERREATNKRLETLKVGDRATGTVVRTAKFGAFVDLQGLEGLIPLSQLGFGHSASVEDRVNIGDLVTVEVMRIEEDPKRKGQMRVSLSLKAALPDPYETYAQYLVNGASLEGKVARLESFGAFVELFDGIDGMIHISELSEQKVRHPSEILKEGDPVTVRVLDVDFAKRRIALSLRENVERSDKLSPTSSLQRGAKSDGVVERIERYGVFLKLANGQTALLPASETGLPRGSDLGKQFAIGTKVSVMVIEVDDRSRLRVSKIAHEKAEEQALVRNYSSQVGKGGLGTLGDLLKARVSTRQ